MRNTQRLKVVQVRFFHLNSLATFADSRESQESGLHEHKLHMAICNQSNNNFKVCCFSK